MDAIATNNLRIDNDNTLNNALHMLTSGKGQILKVTQASISCTIASFVNHSGTTSPHDVDQFVYYYKYKLSDVSDVKTFTVCAPLIHSRIRKHERKS